MTTRTLRVGDRVESAGDPGRWTIVRLIRADAYYHRRAIITNADGDTRTRPVSVLRKVGPMV